MILIQRCGDADDDRVHFLNAAVIRSRIETLLSRLLNLAGFDAVDIGAALAQRGNLALVNIKSSHRELLLGVQQGKRQPYVAQSDDSHLGLAILNSFCEFGNGCGRKCLAAHVNWISWKVTVSMPQPRGRLAECNRFSDPACSENVFLQIADYVRHLGITMIMHPRNQKPFYVFERVLG